MKLLLNGNIEITAQLMPDAYAALKNIAERDGIAEVDVVNLALMTLNEVSQMATKAGKPLGKAIDDDVPPNAGSAS